MAGLRWIFLVGVLAVAGCDRQPAPSAQAPSATPAFRGGVQLPPAQTAPGLQLAYTHEIALELPDASLARHFTAARDRCVTDTALHCLLLHADLENAPARAWPGQPAPGMSADLRVRLPHDQVAGYAAALTASLPGEAPGLVHVTRQTSTADDLGQPVADAAQRVQQLTDYLAALKVLGGRLTISVSDQVKVAEETARAQSQLEEAKARQHDLSLRVDTEELDVTFTPAAVAPPAANPIGEVLAGAQDSLRRNAAQALALAIAALPWVPLGLVGLLLLWVVRRVVFGRRAARVRERVG